MQYFKGDETEVKFYSVGQPILDSVSQQRQAFFDGAYSSFVLGELLYDLKLAPLTTAIPRSIFRESFATVFDAFLEAGSFESYLTVFRNIFGNGVGVVFTVPAPGKLTIAITASAVELSKFIARYISSNAYVFDHVVTQDSDNIVFQSLKGFQTQYELEQMLREMVPAGIFTTISLTLT